MGDKKTKWNNNNKKDLSNDFNNDDEKDQNHYYYLENFAKKIEKIQQSLLNATKSPEIYITTTKTELLNDFIAENKSALDMVTWTKAAVPIIYESLMIVFWTLGLLKVIPKVSLEKLDEVFSSNNKQCDDNGSNNDRIGSNNKT